MNLLGPTTRFCVAAVAIGLLAVAAPGQYQVNQDGRRLDNNLRAGSGGYNAPQVTNTPGAYADALVTGNVEGLAAFRGDVGYRAPSEFRGQLGSDDLFDFTRRSFGANYGSFSPYTTGRNQAWARSYRGDAPVGRYDSAPIVLRSGTGTSVGRVGGNYAYYSDRVDIRRTDVGALTGFRNAREQIGLAASEVAYQPQTLGVSQDAEGRLLEVRISPLTGITRAQLPGERRIAASRDQAAQADTDAADTDAQARPDADTAETADGSDDDRPGPLVAQRVGELGPAVAAQRPGETDEQAAEIQVRIEQMIAQRGARVGLGDRLGSRLAGGLYRTEAGAPDLGVAGSVERVFSARPRMAPDDPYAQLLARIDEQFEQRLEARAGADGDQPDGDGADEDGDGDDPDAANTDADREVTADRQLQRALDRLDYDLPPMTTLSGDGNAPLERAMSDAQGYMKLGQYYNAEAAYDRALVLRQGYPLARVGKAHALLGAGLYVSAARQLRGVFSDHPELIDARYAFPLLPANERVATIQRKLEQQAEQYPRDATAPLLLAYLGHQQADADRTRAMLGTLAERAPRDPLIPLLRRVWLDTDAESDGAPQSE